MNLLIQLRFNLRENENPYFTEAELQHLLDKNLQDIEAASYEGLVIKAEDDSIALPGGLAVPSNRSYWLTLAARHKRSFTGAIGRGDDN